MISTAATPGDTWLDMSMLHQLTFTEMDGDGNDGVTLFSWLVAAVKVLVRYVVTGREVLVDAVVPQLGYT